MKFKNKILKLSLRYTKEKGTYNRFKKGITEKALYNKIENFDEEEIIKSSPFHSPLTITSFAKIEYKDIYANDFIKYLCNLYEENATELFNKFLEENNIKEKYYNHINLEFIRRYTKPIGDYSDITEPLELLKKLYPHTGFIIYAFHWETQYEGHDYWSNKNREWINYFVKNFPNIIYDRRTF